MGGNHCGWEPLWAGTIVGGNHCGWEPLWVGTVVSGNKSQYKLGMYNIKTAVLQAGRHSIHPYVLVLCRLICTWTSAPQHHKHTSYISNTNTTCEFCFNVLNYHSLLLGSPLPSSTPSHVATSLPLWNGRQPEPSAKMRWREPPCCHEPHRRCQVSCQLSSSSST